jgi:hypothetical protein
MYFPRTSKKDRIEVDHSFPWDDWIHKATVFEIGFYAVILSNLLEEQLLNMAFGGKKFSDLFMSRALGRRPKT